MLQLKNITKTYQTGDERVDALRGINIDFRESEFVSILGPSGCGKTTLLNIIGGLDKYTDGDLVISGKSTKEFNDRDWDTYRNHKVGFVFQSYNLISHQSVLSNVELALTLSGVSKAERHARAKEALKKVGLENQMRKKPNQMSGGQMQRVAIARAIVNDPEILLADEPTGALDSATSIQIMELLKEISRDRLVIMVTHNPELAEKYSTRIVRFLDGRMTDDSMPFTYNPDEEKKTPAILTSKEKKEMRKQEKKTSMSFFTALSLSLNNLMTKKARTILTSFAGSIGIIGIALILAISSGLQTYIDKVQEDTLSSYPITIVNESVDMSALLSTMTSNNSSLVNHELDKIYSNVVMYDMLNALTSSEKMKNNLKDFKKYLSEHMSDDAITSVIYGYDTELNIYSSDLQNIRKLNPSDLMKSIYGDAASVYYEQFNMGNFKVWEEMLSGKNGEYINELVTKQYEIVDGRWPTSYNEVVLVADENNEISDLVLCMLGFKSEEEFDEIIKSALSGNPIETKTESWEYSEILNTTFRLVIPTDYYRYNEIDGTWTDMRENETYMSYILSKSEEIKIVGIIRPNEDAVASSISGAIGYTYALTKHVADKVNESEIVKMQKENPDIDVFTGLPFKKDDNELSESEKADAVKEYINSLSETEKAALYKEIAAVIPNSTLQTMVNAILEQYPDRASMENIICEVYREQMGVPEETVRSYLSSMSDEEIRNAVIKSVEENIRKEYSEKVKAELAALSDKELATACDAYLLAMDDASLANIYDNSLPPTVSSSTYDENMDLLGFFDMDDPASINIYASSFEAKDRIAALIDEYNSGVDEEDKISYTDYIKLIMSSITTIINAISYILIAFVSISLVVSSIMIGIITYISVLERTKEIGVLRAIGASKRDVGRVFNAETLLVGFASGMIGIVITLLITIPINLIIKLLTGIGGIAALPFVGAVILVIISMALTLIAGLIPSRIAAKKDPVEALRTE